jgi:hypothetical protein
MHPNVWFSLTGFKTHLPETLEHLAKCWSLSFLALYF